MLDVAAALDPPLICSFNFFLLNILIWFPRKYPKTFDAFRELKENMEKKRIKLTYYFIVIAIQPLITFYLVKEKF